MAPSRRTSGPGVVRAVVGLDFVLFGLVFPLLPLFARHLHLTVLEIGLTLAAYSAAQLVAAPLWGRVADRRGRRSVLVVALVGSAASALGVALAPDGYVLAAAVVFNGASGGSLAVAQAALTDSVEPSRHARELGRLGAYVALGFVLGPALASVSALGGIRVPFVLAAVIGVVNLALALWRFPETLHTRPPGEPDGRAVEPAGGSRAARYACVLALAVAIVGFAAFETTYAILGRERLGFGPVGVSVSFVVVGVVMAAIEGMGIGPALSRLGASGAVVTGSVLMGSGLVLVGLGDPSGAVCGLVLLGAGYGLLSPVFMTTLVRVAPPRRRARTLGWQQAVSGSSRVVGAALGGGLYAAFGPSVSFVAIGVAMLAVVALLASGGLRASLALVASSPRFARSK